jgi:nicotinate-nucleotide adenylyltransferase
VPEERVKVMEVPALAISSSMIRARLAAGLTVRYLVPDAVGQLIEKSGFYGVARPARGAEWPCRT